VVRTTLQPALDRPGTGGAEAVEETLDLTERRHSGGCSNLLGRPLRQTSWIERHCTQKPLCISLFRSHTITLGAGMQDDAVVIADCRRGVTERTRLVDFAAFNLNVLHARPRDDAPNEFQASFPKFVPTSFATLPDELALEFRKVVAHIPAIISVYVIEYPRKWHCIVVRVWVILLPQGQEDRNPRLVSEKGEGLRRVRFSVFGSRVEG
jgi:hypothetical protein